MVGFSTQKHKTKCLRKRTIATKQSLRVFSMLKNYYKWLFTIAISPLLVCFAYAEQALETTQYHIHYNAFNTMMVTPEIASSYDFTRARNRALLNISVLDANTKAPLSAQIKGSRKNLVGQVYPLDFEQIVEQNAIYYIAEMRFSEAELWRFDIKVQPDPFQTPIPLRFNQTFYLEQD